MTDATHLLRRLIRCPSVTPEDAGVMDVLEGELEGLGFRCHRLPFGTTPVVQNIYAVRGESGRNLCFAGHTDVVPPGEGWSFPPFAAECEHGRIFGRGAVDMKGAIAAYVAALARVIESGIAKQGRLSLLITGDEEGAAQDGTVRVLDWLSQKGERLDACLVGEPTNPERLGDMVKVGRRGSLNATLEVTGVQGHVAYPERADNPIPKLLQCLRSLSVPLDGGYEQFPASNLEVTSIDVGNTATNVIPRKATASFNVRFNPTFTGESLEAELRRRLESTGHAMTLHCRVSGEAFLTDGGDLVDCISEAIENRLGKLPDLSTSGGTSDARFITRVCPVVEFGLVGQTMHRVDEHVLLEDLEALTDIYADFIARYLAR